MAEYASLPLYTADQVRRLDAAAIDSGIPGFDLMRRAGRAGFRALRREWPRAQNLLVLCGGGNNGGDGYVMAALGLQQGLAVECLALSDPDKLKGEAAEAWRWYRDQGGQETRYQDNAPEVLNDALVRADVVVDSLLGTGLSGAVRAPYRSVIETVVASGRPVLAVDIPSGLCSDTGRVLGTAMRAQCTPTFIGRKQGLFTGRARDHTGRVVFDDLGVPASTYDCIEEGPAAELLRWQDCRLDAVRPCAHKGDMGRVLVIGGDRGMGGAGLLAAEAALRTGSGLVFLATRSEHLAPALARRPEIQGRAVEHGNDLPPLLEGMDAVVLGPGLGQGPWGQQLWQCRSLWSGPLVLDADGLNLLASQSSPERLGDNTIATPHPGEAARLLRCSVAEVEEDRFAAIQALVQRFGGVWVLKGAGTLVASAGRRTTLIDEGNGGMASGGMGDVLSGVLGSLLGQGVPAVEAARLGVALHGAAADSAVSVTGPRSLLAADVCEGLVEVLAPLNALEEPHNDG